DDEEAICQYWNKKGILGADMETSALFTVGRLRGLHVASILNNVVLYQQDVKEGVGQYVDETKVMMEGEKLASFTALEALIAQA
ncbi:nucleoside phosphorylase, partial [Vibrio alginolyticus]|nr:nucleoside phosphorylase [Vibrio alginolyticus]